MLCGGPQSLVPSSPGWSDRQHWSRERTRRAHGLPPAWSRGPLESTTPPPVPQFPHVAKAHPCLWPHSFLPKPAQDTETPHTRGGTGGLWWCQGCVWLRGSEGRYCSVWRSKLQEASGSSACLPRKSWEINVILQRNSQTDTWACRCTHTHRGAASSWGRGWGSAQTNTVRLCGPHGDFPTPQPATTARSPGLAPPNPPLCPPPLLPKGLPVPAPLRAERGSWAPGTPWPCLLGSSSAYSQPSVHA